MHLGKTHNRQSQKFGSGGKAVRLLTFARSVRLRLQFVDFGSVSVTIRLPITMLIRLNCLLILWIFGAWQLNISGIARILCWTVGVGTSPPSTLLASSSYPPFTSPDSRPPFNALQSISVRLIFMLNLLILFDLL